MMKLAFTGDLQALQAGIMELEAQLGIELAEGGYNFVLQQVAEPTLKVSLHGAQGTIVYSERCQFFRALGLAVQQLQEGVTEFDLQEKPQFTMNGPMFDMSQGNAAFNVKTLKSIIRQLALMGLNTLMVYCEDSFEVKKQPYFGYMRARYSEEEMRELDDYAYSLGIEMIPCIQTLAHMPDTLRWSCFDNIRDYAECLLVGKEETYVFVRDLIEAASRPFRTKKIHIGMDEAFNLGRGSYIDEFGYEEGGEIMRKHLARVMEIVNELGLQPMMWDDMFFRTFGNKSYFQPGATVPQSARELVPAGMKCIYWDYYKLTEEVYDDLMRQHMELSDNVVFAGGCWTWVGFSLAWEKTKIATEAALNVCKRRGIKEVFMTTWGDNGTECLINTNLIGCQLYAEHGYADTIDYEKLEKRFRFCTGGEVSDFAKLELLDRNPQNAEIADHSSNNASKYLMWQDILTGLCDKNIEGYELDAHYAALAEDLKAAVGRNGQFDGNFEYSYHAAHVLALKSQMGLRLTAAYKDGDREALANFARVELPELRDRFIEMRKVHMKNWFKIYKAFGWDVMDMRYGSLLARIDSAIVEIEAYLSGEMERIEELEEERRYYGGQPGSIRYLNFFGDIVSPSRIAPKA